MLRAEWSSGTEQISRIYQFLVALGSNKSILSVVERLAGPGLPTSTAASTGLHGDRGLHGTAQSPPGVPAYPGYMGTWGT